VARPRQRHLQAGSPVIPQSHANNSTPNAIANPKRSSPSSHHHRTARKSIHFQALSFDAATAGDVLDDCAVCLIDDEAFLRQRCDKSGQHGEVVSKLSCPAALRIEGGDDGFADITADDARSGNGIAAHRWLSAVLLENVCGRRPDHDSPPLQLISDGKGEQATCLTTGTKPNCEMIDPPAP